MQFMQTGHPKKRSGTRMEETARIPAKGLNTFHLKLIACLSMLIDHIGAVILKPYNDSHLEFIGYDAMRCLDRWYEACRVVGRIAFPLFCFLLVQGFFYTRSRLQYALRLTLFALLSELPFDLALHQQFPCWERQNVFLTLLISFLTIWALARIKECELTVLPQGLGMSAVIALGASLAYLAGTDYSFKGVLMICALYLLYPLFQTDRTAYVCSGGALFCWEWADRLSRITASFSLLLLLLYNGEKGRSLKWVFYLFYPLHLLLLYFIGRQLL